MDILSLDNISVFSLVLMRMIGCIFFNPILGRRNLPTIFRIGLALALAFAIVQLAMPVVPEVTTVIETVFQLLQELFVGFVIGFIMQVFMGVIMIGGELIDYQMGLSMAKTYDPNSNISMAISATLYNGLFMLLFFTTNAHLNLIRIFLISGDIVPYGRLSLDPEFFTGMLGIFSQSMVLAVKLALPIMALELLVEVGTGIIMRAIPQINVFVINIQLKLLVGILAILLFFAPTANFLERLITLLFAEIFRALGQLG